jgi:3-deoxy-7-phosphoheptulonate synthase
MLESNIISGRQDIPENLSDLKYGVSITDACIGWEETEELIDRAAGELKSNQAAGGK